MAYPLRCFMPHDREVYVDGDHSIQCYSGTCDVAHEESTKFKVYGTESNAPTLLSLAEVEIMFHFNYTKHLIIAHERLLRQIVQDKYDCSPSSVSDGDLLSMAQLVRMLNNGIVSDKVSIRHVGIVNGNDVGYGLFADEDLEAGECLGEYTGVVSSHTSFDAVNMQAYCCQYSSCAGDTYINALEYGNIIRFINHSNSPNAELRSMDIDLVPHVICFTKERIRKDEQIFISYGASYWQNKRQALEQLS
eukprot:gene40631-49538_t